MTSSNVRWETVSKLWANQGFYRAVKPAAAETLFVRHVTKLQKEEAQLARTAAAEVRPCCPPTLMPGPPMAAGSLCRAAACGALIGCPGSGTVHVAMRSHGADAELHIGQRGAGDKHF